MYILGISAYYHDSAAVLICDGEIIAAAQEERFTRKKHDASFPTHAVQYLLKEAAIKADDIKHVAFYDKPFLKFERLLETYHAFVPKGLISFIKAMPVWIKEKLFLKRLLKEELEKCGLLKYKLFFPEHHLSHAASAFYPSPFDKAAVLTLDGVGEWATTTISIGENNTLKVLKELHFPHSLGLLYSAFTYYCGFRVNSGEYKLMGLAPYGRKEVKQTIDFQLKIKEELVDIREDGSFILNMSYFNFATGLKMTNNKRWENLFGIPRRKPESEITQDYRNLAYAIQSVTEEIVLKLATTAGQLSGCKNLTLSGGVALNCVANGKIYQSGLFDNIWVQPASGDAGGALGAALSVWYIGLQQYRKTDHVNDKMNGAYLGPSFSPKEIKNVIYRYSATATKEKSSSILNKRVAQMLSEGKVVGWFSGRMEFGPRALGNRSILADARSDEMQKKLNLKIKYREGFRPFAPIVLEEDVKNYFEDAPSSPYMLFTFPVKNERLLNHSESSQTSSMLDKLYLQRSDVPAITHVDNSARVQTVSKKSNTTIYSLLEAFKKITGCGLLINTSFNVRGEPIVCTPEDAFLCFMNTEMDVLVLEDYVFLKDEQINVKTSLLRKEGFKMD